MATGAVLGAIYGLQVKEPQLSQGVIVGISCAIIILIFAFQARHACQRSRNQRNDQVTQLHTGCSMLQPTDQPNPLLCGRDCEGARWA